MFVQMSYALIFYSEPTDLHGSHPITSITTTNHNTSRYRLDIPSLSLTVHQYYPKGLAASTHKSYQAAIQQYLTLYDQIKHMPVPTNESTLLLYIAHMGKGLFHSTIKVYLSAISLHVAKGQHNHLLLNISNTSNKFFMEYKGN